MKNKLIWHTESHTISELVPNNKNPRMMSEKQVDDLKKSLTKFNVVEIPVIDTDGKVIAGHQRLMVLKLLGRGDEKIEVRVPNRKLTKSEYDQYLLTSNRVHGDWDWEKLAADFDIGTLLSSGFDDTDLTHLFDDLSIENDDFDIDKELEKIKKPKAKLGDIYALGEHRLICADSCDPKTLKKLLSTTKVDVIDTDPPYNIGLSYDKGMGGKKSYGGNVDDSKSDVEYKKFLKSALGNALAHTKPNAHIFTYCDQRYIWLLQTLYQELGIANKRVCLWVKNNSTPTPQIAFNKQYEPCVYGTIGKPYISEKVLNLSEIMNKEVGTGNRTIDDIFDMIDIWLAKRISGADYEHPTEKPPTLHEKALRRCSKAGDVVLDLFGGSGSLLIACEQLKRKAYLVEREPIFVDLIIRRYEKLTGNKARKIS
ncbi:MAG TPA: DNA modification methylase [Candidatus Paceibacterota bacterium]|nr:DNA modification methylase [Candidatus Paceibacterota bacterium]